MFDNHVSDEDADDLATVRGEEEDWHVTLQGGSLPVPSAQVAINIRAIIRAKYKGIDGGKPLIEARLNEPKGKQPHYVLILSSPRSKMTHIVVCDEKRETEDKLAEVLKILEKTEVWCKKLHAHGGDILKMLVRGQIYGQKYYNFVTDEFYSKRKRRARMVARWVTTSVSLSTAVTIFFTLVLM